MSRDQPLTTEETLLAIQAQVAQLRVRADKNDRLLRSIQARIRAKPDLRHGRQVVDQEAQMGRRKKITKAEIEALAFFMEREWLGLPGSSFIIISHYLAVRYHQLRITCLGISCDKAPEHDLLDRLMILARLWEEAE